MKSSKNQRVNKQDHRNKEEIKGLGGMIKEEGILFSKRRKNGKEIEIKRDLNFSEKGRTNHKHNNFKRKYLCHMKNLKRAKPTS